MPATSRPSFAPTVDARYHFVRKLGEGASGEVHLVIDRETGEELAIKLLLRLHPRSIQRFKREFRALANLHHPYLVKLYDLQRARDSWFLTMEYIEGSDFAAEFMRGRAPRSTRDVRAMEAREADPVWIERVAKGFLQLAHGVNAVHEAGMLHRDLKPSNVLVARSGRVVLLDFGLVRGIEEPANDVAVTMEGMVAGTPAYMSPEQADGAELSQASDWYAFGAMLYEVLSGALPIDARDARTLLEQKRSREPAPLPAAVAPVQLRELCLALLQRDPAQRPGAEQIVSLLAQLSAPTGGTETTLNEGQPLQLRARPRRVASMPLLGRDAELAQLRAAFERLGDKRSVAVHLRGPSGAGKSALIEHFLDQLEDAPSRDESRLVLRSRCYEREAMPFKALDGVMDALVGHLARVDDLAVARLLPMDIAALTQLFPVFDRLPAVQSLLAQPGRSRGDAALIRRRADEGLRKLFVRVAQSYALVIWIDDVQWGDLDSANVIKAWLEAPVDAPILLLLSYRSDEVESSACLRALLDIEVDDHAASFARYEIDLRPLPDSVMETLCAERLGPNPDVPQALITRIVREARGSPLLGSQLSALAQAKLSRGEADFDGVGVQELVQRTSALLPPEARELLNVLAVAGRPLPPQLALAAAQVSRDGRAHIHALQSLRLVRTCHVDRVSLLEVYHDRVREAVQSSLGELDGRRVHDRLLRVLELAGQADSGWLHQLALGAGRRSAALRYGKLAAEQASASLAFERAAELYARCLELSDDQTQRASLYASLGLALVRCRRGPQAAEAYLRASELASNSERVPLMQLAASHFLRSGRYEAGEALLQRLLRELDIDLPSTTAGYYAAIAWERTRIALLTPGLRPRIGAPLPAEVQRRMEFIGLLAIETQAYAPLRAVLLQTRAHRMAFQHAEAVMVGRVLCLTATLSCVAGTIEAGQRADKQLAQAEQLLQRVDDPMLRVEVLTARAVCAMLLGRMRDVIEVSSAANEVYETKLAGGDRGDYYYMFTVRTARIGALQNLGQHTLATQELSELLANAQATDNRTAVLQASMIAATAEQANGRSESSRARLDREREQLPKGDFGVLHIMHMGAVIRAACMTGEHDWALAIIDNWWPAYERSPLRHSAYLAYLVRVNRARLVLNHHVARGEPGAAAEAPIRGDLRWLSSQAPTPYRAPSSTRLNARLAFLRGDRPAAAELLQRSAELFGELGEVQEAARDRYALACLLGGERAEAQKAVELAALSGMGIADPAREIAAYYPEFLG